MKNRLYIPVLAAVFLLAACADLVKPSPEEPPVSAGKGRLMISMAKAPRTALPGVDFTAYTMDFSGPPGLSHEPVQVQGGSAAVDLEPGLWAIKVLAYAGETLSGTGGAEVTVNPGEAVPVTITVGRIYTEGKSPGTLRYTVSYPVEGRLYGDQTLTAVNAAGGVTAPPVSLENGREGSLEL